MRLSVCFVVVVVIVVVSYLVICADLQADVSTVWDNQDEDIPYQEMLDSIRTQIDSTSE